jgi:hypothetical protein
VLSGFIVLLLLRGSGDKTSVVGIDRCEPLDWGLLAILIAFMITMTLVAFLVQKRDFELKKQVHWNFLPGDYHFSLKTAIVFPIAGLLFAFTAILLGFTPAFLYITILLEFQLQPSVVTYTNASLTMFSTLCSTIISFLFKTMPKDYFLAGLIFSLIGSIPGIYLQSHVSKLTGRNQYSMMGFNTVIFACLVSITTYQSYMLVQKE